MYFCPAKRNKLLLLSIALLLVLFISACGTQQNEPADDNTGRDEPANQEAELIKLKVAMEDITTYEDFADKFKELAEEKLPGRVEIELYKNAQLGDQKETYEQVQLGTLDMAIGASAQATLEPKYKVFDFPYIFRDREHMEKVITGPIAEELNQELIDKKGIRTVTIFDAGFRSIGNNVRPINSLEDMDGLKIRTPKSPFRMEIFNSLGAAATPIPYSDLFISMQQKVVEGFELPVYDIYESSLYEVADYLAISNHLYTACYLITNEADWQKLPQDVREALQEAADEAADYSRESRKKIETEYVEKLKEKGMQVTYPDTESFAAKMQQTVWKNYEDELGDLITRIVDTK